MSVDPAAAKEHLNITFDTDDALIERLIAAAQDWLERQLGYKLDEEYPDEVPGALDQAVLLLIGHWYANREATLVGTNAQPLPIGLSEIVQDYRNWSWGCDD